MKNNHGKYLNHIWGQKEYGGTSILFISDIDLTKLGWPNKQTVPVPEHTEPLIKETPVIGLTVGGFLVGLNWIIKRRNELTAENNKSKKKIKEEKNNV